MIAYLRAAGTSLVLDARGPYPPVVLHWGADLGELAADELAAVADAATPAVPPSAVDQPLRLTLLPTPGQGWTGRPGIAGHWAAPAGHRAAPAGHQAGPAGPAGAARPTRPVDDVRLRAVRRTGDRGVWVESAMADGRLLVDTEIQLSPEGVLRVRHHVRNTAPDDDLHLASVDVLIPVPDRADELLDFTGLWAHERRPQRALLRHGVWSRETRHGRPGHDDPYLLVAGTPGFGFRTGEVWAAHLAWSGDKRLWAERQATGQSLLGAGELLAPGEIVLPSDATYTSPWTVAVWSDAGLDGLSARLHGWLRSRRPARRPRPVVLNTWEAVYFDHDLDRLTQLVDAAASVGVERFVLDDGWFTGRTDDRRALGDWYVDPRRWPDGLHPLIERVRAGGMDFGLWVEPEMISPDSDLARAHPDWLLGTVHTPTWRHQRVLDLARPAAYDHVLRRLNALLDTYPIAYLKWDHNRDLLAAGGAHRQTTALYRLLTELRGAFPAVEIESCASGGARIDLGIADLVDRFWTSDTNDPLDRQRIMRWTSVLMPLEYLGGHLGADTAHITGRATDLGFRLATALFGHAGIEWDLTAATGEQRGYVADWVAAYKRLRPLLHTGTLVRADSPDPGCQVYGVVDADRSTGLYALVALAAPDTAVPVPLRLVGLDPLRRYAVRPLLIGPQPRTMQVAPPAWLRGGGVTLSGGLLAEVGLPAPLLTPQQAALFTVDAVD
ncbi:alpha-galactosidase [Solwaraspora sp. WMMD406]|uniref:alpha-galactosidase n=1 Tax=Solwaraspora sp. WMMD406 TaxID=3016095 RepID=UPI002417DDAA|nr:alpha-galactosidase [Solwaraspora sp. WMMD406]MDG4766478.1 alpha-galactosidase [Solwaraspora sp. WMMD406]